ncbi:hypothetical protein Y1Q_0009260 [Alligator mississippiensis]|uniref:Integrase catalytic domain-containing protein n=1 Tax=Alligator mississippiensis TaxID=8496 RepID=A0A151M2U6_ALLMI|nr:hypothetical protein Y1Q_0009260 [Alligator mississippiensis]
MGKSGDKRKAPLQPLAIIDQLLQRVGIDIVGPLRHKTHRGKKYILTLVDFATRYPEAIALTSIEAPVVADALTKIFFQLGFPSEILTNRGGNFLVEVMKCLWECCGVKHLKTTAYHPQTNGLIERFNGTLKGMLMAYVDSDPNDWDEKLPHLLFAYQEVPQESTGFSPFELMFGSQDFELHLIHLITMLGKIKQAGLTANAKKCQCALSKVVYLGHCVGGGHIAPLWDKIKAIRDWPPPQTKKQVGAFLGLAGYYRQFVPGLGAMAAPLHELTKKGSPDPVVWKQGCQEAFDTLKAALIRQPILKGPVHDKPFYVVTDASDSGLGAVLLQEHQKTWHLMVYLSQKLIPQEQNLSSIKKECLATIWVLNKLRTYLWGQPFIVLSDHAPLQWLQTVQNTNAKLH